MTLSSSPDRNTFQRDAYIDRCEKEGNEPREDYIQMYNLFADKKAEVEASEEFKQDNLEYDLRSTEWILNKVRSSDVYAQNLYAAICNNEFQRVDVFPILADKRCSYSWRYAGGIIADMQQKGDYIDWYCSGIREANMPDNGYVPESVVTDEIRADLKKLGWSVLDNEDNNF